jgi:asparagine synthase (glutamine-hydrolysing)
MMCGICGKVNVEAEAVDASLVARMCRTLVHRGPDAEGIYTAPYVGLGQRRLSIIDLSREAVAPLSNEDESIWVTYNGEIYNFRELRADLVARGHAFRTAGDTEVIVHLYEEHGVACLAHLHGMFAFALWDARRKRLFAARDRLGKKPFYYARTPRGFVFASEIAALLADPDVSAAPDYVAIDEYLTHQYLPSPMTGFSGICKLPPGHFLVYGSDGTLDVQSYWRPVIAEKLKASEIEIQQELHRRLREAVRRRLVADVPLGAFLSGGIDSSTVVGLMAEVSDRPVKTFSIGFEEDSHNELPHARRVAEWFGTDHHEFIVRPEASEVVPELVRHYGEPFGDSSALPTYHLARMTRQHVTVALSGDGGDENFGGYENHAQIAAWNRADVLPHLIRAVSRGVARALDRLPYSRTGDLASRGLQMIAGPLPQRYGLQTTILKPGEKRAVYTREFWELLRNGPATNGRNGWTWDPDTDPLDWMTCQDLTSYLPDCLMAKVDIASMANSLEVRCPLLDHTLVEFAAAIPSALKRDGSGGKVILRQAVRDLLPPGIADRPKTGFGVPLAAWFRTELAGLLRETLLSDRSRRRGLFVPAFLARMVNEQVSGRRDWSSRLWALLWLELWFREFID